MLTGFAFITVSIIFGGGLLLMLKFFYDLVQKQKKRNDALHYEIEELNQRTKEEAARKEILLSCLQSEKDAIIAAQDDFNKLIGKGDNETTKDKIIIIDSQNFSEVAFEIDIAANTLMAEQEEYLNQAARNKAKKSTQALPVSLFKDSFFAEKQFFIKNGNNITPNQDEDKQNVQKR